MTISRYSLLLMQTGKGALLLDSVPYGRSGDWAVSVWVRFGNLFGNGAACTCMQDGSSFMRLVLVKHCADPIRRSQWW